MKRALRWSAVALAAAVIVLLSAGAWIRWAPRRVPEGQPPLVRLGPDSLAGFRAAFGAGDADVRILALLSPT